MTTPSGRRHYPFRNTNLAFANEVIKLHIAFTHYLGTQLNFAKCIKSLDLRKQNWIEPIQAQIMYTLFRNTNSDGIRKSTYRNTPLGGVPISLDFGWHSPIVWNGDLRMQNGKIYFVFLKLHSQMHCILLYHICIWSEYPMDWHSHRG